MTRPKIPARTERPAVADSLDHRLTPAQRAARDAFLDGFLARARAASTDTDASAGDTRRRQLHTIARNAL